MWCPFSYEQDNLLGGQFWTMGRLNLLGGQSNLLGGQMPTQTHRYLLFTSLNSGGMVGLSVGYLCKAEYAWAQSSERFKKSCCFRDRSQTLVRGADAKRGALKMFDPCKGALKKITTDFPLTIDFTCFSMGLTSNFHGKKRGPEICLLSEGGGETFSP